MTTELEVIQAWLQSCYSVQVPADWLTACTEWIQQENGGQPMSAAQLQPMVFEQWLMSDLKELEAVCLPADLPIQLSTQVKGPFALQVESMVDVGLPLYGQLQKVKGTMNANSEVSADRPYQPAWEPKPSRMMLLKMTDGQTEIQGMEYQPIAALSGNLQPGFKVVIHGQVTCRRGVLMLTADNLQVLGGEVDSLVEANTPVTVLERAMETNSANNGKHAKKEFSGRFINKQDFKLRVSGQKKCKLETTASTLQWPGSCRPGPGSSQAGGQKWCRDVKKEPLVKREPLAPQNTVTMDDEWEEDLDYGGILHTFDEPMEEVSDNIPSASHATSNIAASQSSGAGRSSKQPFTVSSSSAVAKPSTSWQSSASNPHISSARPTNRASTLNSSASRFGQDHASLSIKDKQQDGSLESATGRGDCDGKMWPHASSVPTQKSSAAVVDDSMWEEDDDFVLAQADADLLSPVIPVQSHFTTGPQSARTSNFSSAAACHAEDSGMLKNPGVIKTADSYNSHGFTFTSGNPPNAKGGTNCFSTSLHSTKVRSEPSSSPFSRDSSKNTFPTTSHNSSCSSSAETEPPPPKQCKLTSMLSTVKEETKAEVGSTCLPDAVIDLTHDSLSPVSGRNCFTVKQERNDLSSSAVCKSLNTAASPIGCRDGQNMGTMDHSDEDAPLQTAVAAQNENIFKAVIAPFSSQGTPHAASRNHQPLKDVQSWVQSGSDGEQSFAVKGYITTLTDRLRSGKGDNWSLSCRITDGTDTMEVVISDKVLSHLIGFSAEESITLRQQARTDPKVKDYLTKGLQKCQKALIEFSGLIDLHVTARDAKPVITNMIQLEKKIR